MGAFGKLEHVGVAAPYRCSHAALRAACGAPGMASVPHTWRVTADATVSLRRHCMSTWPLLVYLTDVAFSGCREVPERKARVRFAYTVARSCSSTLLALLTTSRPPRPPPPPSPTPPNMPRHVSFLPLLATLIHAAAAFSPGALLSPALRGASHSAPSLRSSFLQHPAAAATPEWRRRGAERQGQVDLETRNLKPDTAPRNDAVF